MESVDTWSLANHAKVSQAALIGRKIPTRTNNRRTVSGCSRRRSDSAAAFNSFFVCNSGFQHELVTVPHHSTIAIHGETYTLVRCAGGGKKRLVSRQFGAKPTPNGRVQKKITPVFMACLYSE